MRNSIKTLLAGVTLGLMLLSSSCASWLLASPPSLELRTLRLSLEIPGFEYQYEVCVKKILGICTKSEMKKEVYDLRDAEVRKQLVAMGFVARVREKP